MAFRRRNDGFQSFSLLEFLTRPFRAVGSWVFGLLARDAHIDHRDRTAMGSVTAALLFPFRLLFEFAGFMVHSWALTRHGWAFLFALPAIGAVVAFSAASWASHFTRESRSVGASQQFFSMVHNNPEFEPEVAEWFAEKLVGLKPQNDKYKFQLASVREAQGNLIGARDIMSYLAPVDRTGYPEAHVWLARQHMRPTPDMSDDERDAIVIQHLDRAIAEAPDNAFALSSLAEFHQLKAGDFDRDSPQAKEQLAKALELYRKLLASDDINSQLFSMPRVMGLTAELESEAKAKFQLAAAIKNTMPMMRRMPDFGSPWKAMVSSCVEVKDYEAAQQVIDEGLQLVRDLEVRNLLVQMSSLVVLKQAEGYTDMTDRQQYVHRLNLLCFSIVKQPRDRAIYQQVIGYVSDVSNPDFNLTWLQESLIDVENPGVVHVLLGFYKMKKGDVLAGQKHWRIAEQLTPETQFIVNVLIDVAVEKESEDFENMLDVITLAIEYFPKQPLLYQTRGKLFKKKRQYDEAIVDFLHVAEEAPRLLVVRKDLIDCYEAVGKVDEADNHQTEIQKILRELQPTERRHAQTVLDRIDQQNQPKPQN